MMGMIVVSSADGEARAGAVGVLGATLVGVAVVTVAMMKWWWWCNDKNDNENDHVVSVRLVQSDKDIFQLDEPPICTLTWFRGNHREAVQLLRQRAQQIVQANPWLGGRIVRQKGDVFLMYKTNKNNDDDDDDGKKKKKEAFFDPLVHIAPQDSVLHRDMALDQLGHAVAQQQQQQGITLTKNGPHEPLWRVAVVPCATRPETSFALLLSMSHIAGDGHTFYALANMLLDNSSNSIITSLQVQRIADTTQQQAQYLGKTKSWAERGAWGFLVTMMRGAVVTQIRHGSNRPPTQHFFWLDTDRIQKLKQQQQPQQQKDDDDDDKQDYVVPFVSTNDILTSWFFNITQAPIGTMVVNVRNRIPGHTDQHAGNYTNLVWYRPPDYDTPSLIRKSIGVSMDEASCLRRAVTSHQEFTLWETLVAKKYSIVTNWTSFAKPAKLDNCTEELHVPLSAAGRMLPSTLNVMVIFRAGPGKVGLSVLEHEAPRLKNLMTATAEFVSTTSS